MDKQKINEYKKILEEERERLIAEIKKSEKGEDFGSDIDHGDEEADEAESLSEKLAIGQDYRERVSEIDAALSKIEKGTYGKCEKCGGEIEEEVLNASPESRFCKKCKLAG